MNTKYSFDRLVRFSFLLYELVDSIRFDKHQVLNLTHSVFCSVSFVQILEPDARKVCTVTVPALSFLAVLYLAKDAVVDLIAIDHASAASVPLPKVRNAQAAVHSAGCDEVPAYSFHRHSCYHP